MRCQMTGYGVHSLTATADPILGITCNTAKDFNGKIRFENSRSGSCYRPPAWTQGRQSDGSYQTSFTAYTTREGIRCGVFYLITSSLSKRYAALPLFRVQKLKIKYVTFHEK